MPVRSRAASRRLAWEPPAEQAGLEDGDQITRIEGEPIADWDAVREAINRRPKQPTRVEVQRDGQPRTLEVTPNEGAIGVKPVLESKPMGVGRSLARAAIEPLRIVLATVTSLVRISMGTDRPSFVGSGAVAREIDKAHHRSLADAIYLVALVAAYVWPVFVVLELLLAAGMWRERTHLRRRQGGRAQGAAG